MVELEGKCAEEFINNMDKRERDGPSLTAKKLFSEVKEDGEHLKFNEESE